MVEIIAIYFRIL